MNRAQIEEKLVYILNKYFDVDKQTIKNNQTKLLIEEPFSFDYLDLVYLYVLLIQNLDISFNEKNFLVDSFFSVNSIVDLVVNTI